MVGIYLLVTILSQLSTSDTWIPPDQGAAEVVVNFQKSASLTIGAPVVVEGELIGTVIEIAPDSGVVAGGSAVGSTVKVKIAPRHRALLRRGTVALIASPLSVSRTGPETVLELLLPQGNSTPLLAQGEAIAGYCSYEEFWSSAAPRAA